jgi:dipeptidase
VIGSIPEVATTYAYIDGAYGIINEHQVAIGESTCGARYVSKPVSQGGAALFDISELSRLALQRTKTAREAIQLMGDLAVQYGYYGAEWEGEGMYGEAGEALTVTDTKEAWMFHILPDDTGKSAIWAAQRVPDNHIAAVANQFVIHEVELNNTEFFMASPNLHEVAVRNNLWTPDAGVPFDFTRVYSQPRDPGHQYYSTRRVWRVFTLANPGLELSPYTDVYASDYPFSVETARPLSPHDIMRFQRDHYEDTPFDMTQGPASGPYGNPDRYDQSPNGFLTSNDLAHGHFERAISIFRASYSFVSVLDASNADNAFLWFGQYAPHATVYAPVYVKADATPSQYANASLFQFDRGSSFWINALVGNWAARFYVYAHPFVEKVQLQVEQAAENVVAKIATQAATLQADKGKGDAAVRSFLTEQTALFASQSHTAFSDLFEYLVTVFHDGYEMSGFMTTTLTAKALFYPKWWLELVGFFNDSQQPAEPPTTISIPPSSSSRDVSTAVTAIGGSNARATVSYSVTALVAFVAGGVGVFIGRRYATAGTATGYKPIR